MIASTGTFINTICTNLGAITDYTCENYFHISTPNLAEVGKGRIPTKLLIFVHPGIISFLDEERSTSPRPRMESLRMLVIFNESYREQPLIDLMDEFLINVYNEEVDTNAAITLHSFVPYEGHNPIGHNAWLLTLGLDYLG